MYRVGELKDAKLAQAIVDELNRKGINSKLMTNAEGELYSVTVENEVDIPAALDFYRIKLGFPAAPKISSEWTQIKKLKMGLGTKFLLYFSIGISLFFYTDLRVDFLAAFSFSNDKNGLFIEILNGEIWRLLSPIFMHFGFLHLLFNMMWLRDLGAIFEKKFGSQYFLMFVITTSLISNILQYLVTGPFFGGMSGVVYGLLAFLVSRQIMDPDFEYSLPKHDIGLMVVWFCLCLFGIFGPIANMAHAGGLFVGGLWGLASSFKVKIFKPAKALLLILSSLALFSLALIFDYYK